jgi:hypothetical protein
MFKATFREWIEASIRPLAYFRTRLTPCNQKTLRPCEQARVLGLPERLKKSSVHRQSLRGTVGLAAAASLQRI